LKARRERIAPGLHRPGIEYLRVQRKIMHVAGNYSEAVALGCGHEQAIHYRDWLPGRFGMSGDLSPDMESGGIQRQDAPCETLFHLA
jgi:hypothetical protein